MVAITKLLPMATGLPSEVLTGMRSLLSKQDDMNQSFASTFNSLAKWTWQTPQLLGTWVNFSSTVVARFTQLPTGQVVLSGTISSGTINTTAFTLPVGMRPDQDVAFAAATDAGYGLLAIHSSGAVVPTSGGTVFFALDCIFLPAVT